MTDQYATRTAPFYSIPSRHIVSVEHPAIIRNVDKAIDTLYGDVGVSKILYPPKADTPANLVLRPEDALSRPLQSTSSTSNNILLKVTVPKRTGRKRRRGSNEPFSGVPFSTVNPEPQRRSARELLRSLRDNVARYDIEPVGMVNRTHVFRGIPDFVYSTTASSFTNRFRDQILPFDYEKMKQWDIDPSKGAISNVDIIPPPSFSHGDIPFSYFYRQNAAVQRSIDTSGNITIVNTSQAAKVQTHLIPYDIPAVPTKPSEDCPPIDTLDITLQETIALVEKLFADRPAWTRRGLRNALKTQEQRYALRYAIPYVGYVFRSGPWRDAIVKFGHDPRSSPDYRIYQTAMFRTIPREPELARDGGSGRRHTLPRPSEIGLSDPISGLTTDSHIFSGQPPLAPDGRMWMFCDVTDPLLCQILFPDPPPPDFLRTTCDIQTDGWYGNGTLAKAKTVMRAKIQTLMEDQVPDDADFARILRFPDHARLDDALTEFTLEADVASSREMQLASEIRSTIRGTPGWRDKITSAMDVDRDQGQAQENAHAPTTATIATTPGRGKGAAAGAAGRTPTSRKRVQWREDVEEEESEGEEEAIEQEELLEAQVQAAAAAAEAAATAAEADEGSDEDLDEAEEMDIEEPTPRRR